MWIGRTVRAIPPQFGFGAVGVDWWWLRMQDEDLGIKISRRAIVRTEREEGENRLVL